MPSAKFVVMAGCDGRMKSRDYYADFAQALLKDTVILTAGCAKYRYNKLPLGDIQGIPRVLDAGQCNDSYSLAVIALKFEGSLPVERHQRTPHCVQHCLVRTEGGHRPAGPVEPGRETYSPRPTLPAFLSPNVAKVLVEQFGIGGITTPRSGHETVRYLLTA